MLTELKLVAVTPIGDPIASTLVTIVTPVAKLPKASRKLIADDPSIKLRAAPAVLARTPSSKQEPRKRLLGIAGSIASQSAELIGCGLGKCFSRIEDVARCIAVYCAALRLDPNHNIERVRSGQFAQCVAHEIYAP